MTHGKVALTLAEVEKRLARAMREAVKRGATTRQQLELVVRLEMAMMLSHGNVPETVRVTFVGAGAQVRVVVASAEPRPAKVLDLAEFRRRRGHA